MKRRTWKFPLGWMLAWLIGMAAPVWAHKSSDSYLRIRVEPGEVRGEWELALHDLEFAVGLDGNGDGAITWGELKARRDAVVDYARSRLGLAADDAPCDLRFDREIQVDQLANGCYVVLRWSATIRGEREPQSVQVDNSVIFDGNPLHRGLTWLEAGGKTHQAIFSPTETRHRFELGSVRPWREFLSVAGDGVWHIWMGYDHLLFLGVLLIPSVLRREGRDWVAEDRLRTAFGNVVRIVTAFTVAHSITLSLAALGVVRLPSRVVEPVIAASIAVAALNNFRPVMTSNSWWIAFGFGLVHGFGFASVLTDLGLPRGAMARALVGFNLGVEAGQLAVVALLLPVAYGMRGSEFYRRWVLNGGSLAAAVLAGVWVWQRLGTG